MIDLWDLARSANFTEKELESFRVRRQTSALGSVGKDSPAPCPLCPSALAGGPCGTATCTSPSGEAGAAVGVPAVKS